MSWFHEVTGQTPSTQKAWRDNFNGGWAAGDLTGNINRQIAYVNGVAYGGGMYGGYGGPPPPLPGTKVRTSRPKSAVKTVSKSTPGRVTARPVRTPAQVSPKPASTRPKVIGNAWWADAPPAKPLGPGAPVVSTPLGPLKPVMKDTNTPFMVGGVVMHPHPGTSDAEEIEARWGEAEFLSPAWFANWAVTAVDVYHNSVTRVPKQTQFQPGGGAWITEAVGDWFSQANSPFGPDKPIPGFDRGGF